MAKTKPLDLNTPRTDAPGAGHTSLILVLVGVLLATMGSGCRRKAKSPPPNRPGDISLVHPLARGVHHKNSGNTRITEMTVNAPLRRVLAYYEHGLAKGWHLVWRRRGPQGVSLRVRRGRQIMDIEVQTLGAKTQVRITQTVQQTDPGAAAANRPAPRPPVETTDASKMPRQAPPAGSPSSAASPIPRPTTATPLAKLPKGVRLPSGWRPIRAGAMPQFLHTSKNLSKLSRALKRTMTANGWKTLPTPEAADTDVSLLLFTKGTKVVLFRIRKTFDGTLLSVTQQSP